eukprot:1147832-Pelagomonas_calceolata.AAC.4
MSTGKLDREDQVLRCRDVQLQVGKFVWNCQGKNLRTAGGKAWKVQLSRSWVAKIMGGHSSPQKCTAIDTKLPAKSQLETTFEAGEACQKAASASHVRDKRCKNECTAHWTPQS